jgi:protein MAK16
MAPKIKRREETRERKAEAAAKLERTIERELIERLRQGAYGDQPLNVSEAIWKKVLNALEREGEGVRDKDMDKGIEDDEEEVEEELEDDEEELDGAVEYVSDFDESDEELADIEDWLGSDEDDDEEDDDDDDEDDSEEEANKKKSKTGDKRKRGRVVRMKPRKKKELEIEEENSRQKLLAF